MVTASRDGHPTTRNSSFFKSYRELTYEDEKPGNQLPERREEAPPTENLVPASAEQPRPQPPSPRSLVPRPQPPSPRLQEPPPQPPESSEPRRSERVRTKTLLFSNALPSNASHSNASQPGLSFLSKKGGEDVVSLRRHKTTTTTTTITTIKTINIFN
jgi:hypothetical protein